MSERIAMTIFATGLFVMIFGVGLVEDSVIDSELAIGVVVSLLGSGIMWTAVPTLSDC